jgi:hypothetical protein
MRAGKPAMGRIERIANAIAAILAREGIDYLQSKAVFKAARQKAGLTAPPDRRGAIDRLTLEEELRFIDRAYAKGGRTGLLLQTLLETGTRVSELVQLRVEDYVGPESAAFAPFVDSNPDAPADERYKAVAYRVINRTGNVMALVSPDGIHWKRLQEEPILPPGSFDSLNTAHWDATAGVYRMYGRYWTGGHFKGMRGIQSSTSKDFRTWSAPKPNTYDDGVPIEEFYTNAVLPCPDAPHHLLSFPMRFIPGRKKIPGHPYPGVSDAVFMSSRDGIHWDRPFREAWVRPGLDKQNWTDRSNMPAWGIIETADGEFSMYLSEHYRWPDNRLRRMTVRKHGFASIGAGAAGGEILTKPIVVRGKHLVLNYATSAAGSVQVEVQDAETPHPIPGFALSDMPPLFGDEIAAPIAWKSDADLSSLIGKPVRFRFVLTDADIFSLQITD